MQFLVSLVDIVMFFKFTPFDILFTLLELLKGLQVLKQVTNSMDINSI